MSSHLPKCMREIRFDKIGFNVLADTHNMRYALSLQNWQLDKETEKKYYELETYEKCISLLFFLCVTISQCQD